MKKNKFLFAALTLAMASFCSPSPAQTTECGTDSGCFAYYTKITKTSPKKVLGLGLSVRVQVYQS